MKLFEAQMIGVGIGEIKRLENESDESYAERFCENYNNRMKEVLTEGEICIMSPGYLLDFMKATKKWLEKITEEKENA